MSNNWQVKYDELMGFMSKNPSIVIKPDVLSIPGEVRPDFYALFDCIRENFVRDNYTAPLDKAIVLSSSHERIKNELIAKLALEELEIRSTIRGFISDPMANSVKLLFDPLFDLLMGKIGLAAFEEVSNTKLKMSFDTFFQHANQSWVMLSLLKLLDPDEVYVVPPPLNELANEFDSVINDSGGMTKQMPPDTIQSNRISFNTATFASFMFPKVIVHSKLLNLFVSIASDFRNVPIRVVYLNKNVDWLPLMGVYQTVGNTKIWPDIAIYMANQPNDLVLVSDNQYIAVPDIIMSIEGETRLRETSTREILNKQDQAFKARVGNFVISPDMIQDADLADLTQQLKPRGANIEAPAEPAETSSANKAASAPAEKPPDIAPQRGIDILSVGYDETKLGPIFEAILHSEHYSQLVPPPAAPAEQGVEKNGN